MLGLCRYEGTSIVQCGVVYIDIYVSIQGDQGVCGKGLQDRGGFQVGSSKGA